MTVIAELFIYIKSEKRNFVCQRSVFDLNTLQKQTLLVCHVEMLLKSPLTVFFSHIANYKIMFKDTNYLVFKFGG